MSVLKRSEKSIQEAVVRYARERGAVAIKLSTLGSYGTSGWPDYLFLSGGRAVLMEFKRAGGSMTPRQYEAFHRLAAVGFSPYLIDNVAEGRNTLAVLFGWEFE